VKKKNEKEEKELQLEFVCRECGSQQMSEATVWPHVSSCRGHSAPRMCVSLKPSSRYRKLTRLRLLECLEEWFCPHCARRLLYLAPLWIQDAERYCPRCRRSFELPSDKSDHWCTDCRPCSDLLVNQWQTRINNK
jgi:DNA-directed RNA polymerase subunit RPC12/RpoP